MKLLALAGLLLAFGAQAGLASPRELPPAPVHYVLDEPQVLPPEQLVALQTILVEHAQTTGEHFMVAVFNDLGTEKVPSFARRVLEEWKIGRQKNSGILLLLDWKSKEAVLESGFALDQILSDTKCHQVIHDFLEPELRADRPARAVALAVIEVLRLLEAPLVQSGKAQEALVQAGFQGDFAQPEPVSEVSAGAVTVGFGLAALLLLVLVSVAPLGEAHYTARGWFRPRSWWKLKQLARSSSQLSGGGGTYGAW